MPLPAVLHHWCAAIPVDDIWIMRRALNPCVFEAASVAVIVSSVLLTLLLNVSSIKHAASLRKAGQRQKGPKGMSGTEAGYLCGVLFVGGIHVIHAAVALLHLPPFHYVFHLTLVASWAAVAACHLYASKVHVVLDFRPFTCTAVVMYLWALETYWSLYRVVDGFPLSYMRATIWSYMLQSVVTLIITVVDFKRHRKPPAAPAGYEPLPGSSRDVEEGAGGLAATAAAGGAKAATATAGAPVGAATGSAEGAEGERGWVSLFCDACLWVWPEKPGLQARTLLAFALLLAMRGLNLAVPIMYKKLVDSMAAVGQQSDGGDAGGGGGGTGGGSTPLDRMFLWGWLSPWVLLYLGALFFQGGAGGGMMGAINNLRQVLWIPVAQDAYRRISLRIFSHVLGLDLGFHLGRKTGEVTKQVDRGTNAMQNILSTILFSIVPTVVDVLAASTYLAQALEPSIAVTVFLTVGSYIPVTIIITEWRGSLRREMNKTDQIQSARVTDALLNYETVHYFGNLDHETKQYANAIGDYQSAEYKSMASVNLLNSVQSGIMWVGISVGLLVCVRGVAQGDLTVGDVVLFLQLMAQLYAPLNWFGAYYRTIQQYMIDMENLFQLLDKQSSVQDVPGAKDLVVSKGEVAYDDVSFEYERGTPVLKNVTFTATGGQTIAFVGATGSGKSTLTRLVFRFYDVTGGAISIDGQDIRAVSQKSLRAALGMVPQDTVLFNDTIMTNIRYGRLDATDQEVFEAAQAACIHEAITTRFPKGYETMVGERGLRLSGGEKQRVAFARALLKNPAILVLDEATSALDTLTERRIQAALVARRQGGVGRTTLIVAHRLSTIVDAHMIVVMHLGQVAEMGTHADLLAKGGMYAEMWNKQLTSASVSDLVLLNDTASASNGTPPAAAAAAGGQQANGASGGAATTASNGGSSSTARGHHHHGHH